MIDITALSPAQLEKFIHIQSVIFEQTEKYAEIRALRRYYKGEHPVMLTLRQKEYLGPLLTEAEFTFAHNLIKTIIDTLRERLSVEGFLINGQGADDVPADNSTQNEDADLAIKVWRWFKLNRMASKQIRLYRRALRDGYSYLIVDYDPVKKMPRINLHKAYDGNTGVTVHRNPENMDEILFCCRYFFGGNIEDPGGIGVLMKTVYLPGEVRKYRRSSDNIGGWVPSITQGEEWPIKWQMPDGSPIGIACIEFANPGGSEASQIVGLQNALNKAWLDLMSAADSAGFPVMSIEYDDPEGLGAGDITDDYDLEGTDEFNIAPGNWVELFGAKLNRLDPPNLDHMINVIWTIVQAISGVSRTPQYYLRPLGGSEVPSGEALKQLESGLVMRAIERHLVFGESWSEAISIALRVDMAYGASLPQNREVTIDTQWADPNVRFELTEAQIADIQKRLDVPIEKIWEILGYSPEEIADMKESRRADEAAKVAQIAQAIIAQQNRNAPQDNPARPDSGL